jgi:hypothetical protein
MPDASVANTWAWAGSGRPPDPTGITPMQLRV